MPAPVQPHPIRPDAEVIRIPRLSEWLSLAAGSDSAVWAAYADYRLDSGAVK